MNFPNVLNTFFGSALIIILLFAECILNFSGNRQIKRLFCSVLIIVFSCLVLDFIYSLFLLDYNINIELLSFRMIWPITAALLLFVYLFFMIKENRVDILTGLGNRYSFFEFFNRLSRNKTGDSWSIAILDINNFKSINDIYGHLEGDNALRNLAKAIKKCSKKTDFTARYGSDEFILVTRSENELNKLIAGIEEELAAFNDKNNKLYDLEISYGFDTYIADGNTPIDTFLNHISNLVYRNNEEERRTGDLNTEKI